MSFGEYLGASARKHIAPGLSHVFGPKRGHLIRAVGCKVFYDYFDDPLLIPALDHLLKMPGLHVIHLTRQNLLESYLSLLQAQSSHQWTGSGEQVPVRIDIDDCIKYFKSIKVAKTTCERTISRQQMMHVTYENLTTRKDQTLKQVTDFLQVPGQTLGSILEKQARGGLADRIINYAEVNDALQGTPWESFLKPL